MIQRSSYLTQLKRALGRNPIVAMIGPRQCGKTTLARQILPSDHANFFDLEDPVVAELMENPMTTPQNLCGVIVIDEAQREPRLFPVLRVRTGSAHDPTRTKNRSRIQTGRRPNTHPFHASRFCRSGIRRTLGRLSRTSHLFPLRTNHRPATSRLSLIETGKNPFLRKESARERNRTSMGHPIRF